MSSKLGVDKTLELLDGLKATVADFTAREEKYERDFKIRMMKERQRHDAAAQEQMATLTDTISRTETDFQAARQAAANRFERRKAVISEARKTSKEQALTRIESKTGTRKYELQKRLIQAEKNRDAGLAAAVETLEGHKLQLAEQREVLAGLQRRVRGALRAYPGFGGKLARAQERAEISESGDENQLLSALRELIKSVEAGLKEFRGQVLANVFKFLPIWLLLPLCAVPAALQHFKVIAMTQPMAIGISAGAAVVLLIIYFVGRQQAAPLADKIAAALGKAARLHEFIQEKAARRYDEDLVQLETDFKTGTQLIDHELKQAIKDDVGMKGSFREDVDAKTVRISARNEKQYRASLARFEREQAESMARLKNEATARKMEIATDWLGKEARFNAEYEAQWAAMEKEWNEKTRQAYETIAAANASAQKLFPPWKPEMVESWQPPQSFRARGKVRRARRGHADFLRRHAQKPAARPAGARAVFRSAAAHLS